jgi:hypothetical protein
VSRYIYRYEVVVGHGWQRIPLKGPVLHVGSRQPSIVELWALYDSSAPTRYREFIVVGTGQPVPVPPVDYHGSVLCELPNDTYLVWHLLSRQAP